MTTMPYTTLISTAELARHIDNPDWVVVDVRFALRQPDQGERDYLAGHIAGAVYAHLDRDLSSPQIVGATGRHPLPPLDALSKSLGQWGIDHRTQVVVYDDAGGMMAGRLWWMLHFVGHDAVALLDGGWPRWREEGLPVRTGSEMRASRQFAANPYLHLVATAQEIEARLGDPALRLLDARAADRFRGENETLDPLGGHIPGAISAPYMANLGADGLMLSAEQLRTRYEQLLDGAPADEAIVYCGSGVSAAHDVLAIRHAGLPMPRLYVGSWSDWVSNGVRPVAQG